MVTQRTKKAYANIEGGVGEGDGKMSLHPRLIITALIQDTEEVYWQFKYLHDCAPYTWKRKKKHEKNGNAKTQPNGFSDNGNVTTTTMTTFLAFCVTFNYHRNFNAFNESIERNYIRRLAADWEHSRACVLNSSIHSLTDILFPLFTHTRTAYKCVLNINSGSGSHIIASVIHRNNFTDAICVRRKIILWNCDKIIIIMRDADESEGHCAMRAWANITLSH